MRHGAALVAFALVMAGCAGGSGQDGPSGPASETPGTQPPANLTRAPLVYVGLERTASTTAPTEELRIPPILQDQQAVIWEWTFPMLHDATVVGYQASLWIEVPEGGAIADPFGFSYSRHEGAQASHGSDHDEASLIVHDQFPAGLVHLEFEGQLVPGDDPADVTFAVGEGLDLNLDNARLGSVTVATGDWFVINGPGHPSTVQLVYG